MVQQSLVLVCPAMLLAALVENLDQLLEISWFSDALDLLGEKKVQVGVADAAVYAYAHLPRK